MLVKLAAAAAPAAASAVVTAMVMVIAVRVMHVASFATITILTTLYNVTLRLNCKVITAIPESI